MFRHIFHPKTGIIAAVLSAAAVFSLLFSLPLVAQAEQPAFEDKSWEGVVDELFQKYEADPDTVTLAYYNTVTGEEHYHNPDQYMVTASMYKVPLNMYFAQQVSAGELDWEDKLVGQTFRELMAGSIVYSSNDKAMALIQSIGDGSYLNYRREIAPFMGVDPDNVDSIYYANNYFTARQMLHCLKLLYSEQERFPGIIDYMLEAEPERYFRLREDRFDIAHKYGYVREYNVRIVNDCGIVYTDEPILLVIFTRGTENVYDLMADYCSLMCDYAQAHVQPAGTAEPTADPTVQELSEPEQTPDAPAPSPEQEVTPQKPVSFFRRILSVFSPGKN